MKGRLSVTKGKEGEVEWTERPQEKEGEERRSKERRKDEKEGRCKGISRWLGGRGSEMGVEIICEKDGEGG